MTYLDLPDQMEAAASSGLSITYSLISGSCTLEGGVLTYTGAGICKVRASQGGNSEWNPESATREIVIDKAPQVFTFPDRTYPWQPESQPISLWATLPSGAKIDYDVDESTPDCEREGTTVKIVTVELITTCKILATQIGSHPNYLDPPPVSAILTVDFPNWTWSYEPSAFDWKESSKDVEVTIYEMTGTTEGASLGYPVTGPCTVGTIEDTASPTEFTVTVTFTEPGTCDFDIMGEPFDFSEEGGTLDVKITAVPPPP